MADRKSDPTLEPLPLEYASPTPPATDDSGVDPLLRIGRRLVFALGLGLLSYGVVAGLSGVDRGDAPTMAGWGGGLIGLAFPRWCRCKD